MTNEDAISREAVIRLVEQYPNIIGNRCSGLIADIKHLPPITPSYNSVKTELEQTRWIPVSERLPEECISVLVWCPERKNIYCAYYKHNEWFIFGGYNHCLEEVIAWMPLPPSYQGE